MSDPNLLPPSLSSLAPQQKSRYLALYNFWLGIETNLQAQITARTLGQPINSYTFSAGEGSQTTSRMTIKEMMDALTRVEGMVRLYAQKVYGRGLMSHMLRRR